MADEKLIGYQEHVEWMGERILTLADVWPEQAHTAIVGLNPAPKSVAAGHYYQGLVGSRQMGRLADAGLFAPPDGSTIEAATLAAGIGLTDVVKRPTAREDAVTRAELTFGRAALELTLRVRGVSLVVCVFRHPVEVLLGGKSRPGFQHKTTASGAEVFRMPGPFERADDVEAVMSTLRERIRS